MIDRESEDWKTIETKAGLLCLGLSASGDARELYSVQNPYQDWKTGNVGLHLALNKKTTVLVTVSHKFNRLSPYQIVKKNGKWRLLRGSEDVGKVDPIIMPGWYGEKTSTGKPMPEIFLHEGLSFMHMCYKGCDYFRTGEQCRFCGTGAEWKVGTPQEMGEIVAMASSQNKDYQVCLGGGTRLPRGKDVEYFTSCLTEIRKSSPDVPVYIEMVPPETNEEIKALVDAGASALSFNIEIWNDKLRSEICPGKAGMSKQRYLDAMGYATELLGPDKVGSVLVVGLEDPESSIEGSRKLNSRGVRVCMPPFKPWDNSVFEKRKPCSPETLLNVARKTAEAMLEYGVDPKQNVGCSNCESCTVEDDILELLKGEF